MLHDVDEDLFRQRFAARDPLGDGPTIAAAEPVQRMLRDMAMTAPLRGEFWPIGHHDQHRKLLQPLHEDVQCLDARRINPVDILDQHHKGLFAGEHF